MENAILSIVFVIYHLSLLLYIKKIYRFGHIFSLFNYTLRKFDYKNAILFGSFKKIRIYIIFNLLQYDNAKYLLYIHIILIKIKLILIKIS